MGKEDHAATGRTEREREGGTTRSSRRRLLCGLAAGFSLLAGCSSLSGGDNTDTASPTSQTSTTTAGRATETATETATPAETTTSTATPDATPTPLPTEAPTATETATPTATPLPTRTPAGTATPASTSSLTPAGGGVSITPNDLTTFTDPRIGYTIKYPSEWSPSVASVATPSWVSITPSSDTYSTFTGINIYGYSEFDFSPSTLDAFTAWFIDLVEGTYDELTVKRRRTVTLPNGNNTRVLYARARVSGFPDFRLTWLFTIVNGIGYAVQVRFLDKAYTPTLRRTVDAIVESFTIKTNSS